MIKNNHYKVNVICRNSIVSIKNIHNRVTLKKFEGLFNNVYKNKNAK